ncbi:MAG: DUF2865 domain-containing protein [Variibacter sp.]
MSLRITLPIAIGLALISLPLSAPAQAPYPPPGGYQGGYQQDNRSPACQRLEAQLAGLDRNPQDAGRADQIRRYEEAENRQQQELDRLAAQSQRLGCDRGGGFFLFGRSQPPQCDQLNRQIQSMRQNLDRITSGLEQLRGSGNDREQQRRSIMVALAQNDCGQQYRAAVSRQRGFFDSLFGGGGGGGEEPGANGVEANPVPSGTYRTLCVRTCDGYYFPISYATVPSRFADDERACHRMCPAAEAILFTHRNPGEDMSQAVSINGRRYADLPTAFAYRQSVNKACTCKPPGETWAQALSRNGDETLQRGDIVVTDDKAKAMQQPRAEPPPRQSRPSSRGGRTSNPQSPAAGLRGSAAAAAAPPAPTPDAPAAQSAPATARPRAVGPQYLQPQR